MGRHGGRSGDNRGHELAIEDRITVPGASAPPPPDDGVKVPAPLGGSRPLGSATPPASPPAGLPVGAGAGKRWWENGQAVSAAPSGHPWWDDAPVPPPVVVASADGRTPAMTFAPDADPFSAGGVFAPPAVRVLVRPCPDPEVVLSVRPSDLPP